MADPVKVATSQLLSLQQSQGLQELSTVAVLAFPISAAPQELSTVETPFWPQPTALVKRHCRSCPIGAVHSGGTSSPAFHPSPPPSSPTGMAPQ